MNIAKILKYCPKGTKLYSPMYGNVILDSVLPENSRFPIIIKDGAACQHVVTEQGYYTYNLSNLECVLFPSKDQRDWSKFRLPFKAGDIVMTIDKLTPFIFKEYIDDVYAHCYCGVDVYDTLKIEAPIDVYWTSSFIIPASKEAKKELFDKMKEAGYRWNADTLELEKIEPKFKEGDVIELDNILYLTTGIIKNDELQTCCLMMETTINVYEPEFNNGLLNIATLATKEKRNKLYSALIRYGYKYDKEQHKLIKQEFKPFDKVLVRRKYDNVWMPKLYAGFKENSIFPYICVDGYEGTQ